MKFILNSVFLGLVWRRYKRLILVLAFLFGSYFIISMLHADYLGYVKNSGNDTHLGLSYSIKWLALIIVTIVFYFLISRGKTQHSKKTFSKSAKPQNQMADKPDPFDALRHKKTLRGKADHVLDDKLDNK